MEEKTFNNKKVINYEGLKILGKIIAKKIIKETGQNNEKLTINSTIDRLSYIDIKQKGEEISE
jgi:hypothetical protein